LSLLQRFFNFSNVDKDTIALDLIDKVGIGGNFLIENHSLEHFKNEAYSLIYNAIQTLSPREKQVIELTLDGLKNPEIAKQLDVSVNTVKTLKSRAFKTLRAVLKGVTFQFFALLYPEIFE